MKGDITLAPFTVSDRVFVYGVYLPLAVVALGVLVIVLVPSYVIDRGVRWRFPNPQDPHWLNRWWGRW